MPERAPVFSLPLHPWKNQTIAARLRTQTPQILLPSKQSPGLLTALPFPAQHPSIVCASGQRHLFQESIFPIDIPCHSAAQPCTQQRTLVPLGRQRRQQQNLPLPAQGVITALQDCTGDSRSTAKISVNLKRRMVVKKIGQGGTGQQKFQILLYLLGVPKLCPEIDDPGAGSNRCALRRGKAGIPTFFVQLPPAPACALRLSDAGIQPKQVGDMPVSRFPLPVRFQPFHDPPVIVDLYLWQPL